MSTLPSLSPSETSSKETSLELSQSESRNLTSESTKKRYPKYPTRNGRSWCRKDDLPPIQPEHSNILVGIQAIALFCDVSYGTVRNWIKAGLPIYHPINGRYCIHPSVLFQWLIASGQCYQRELSEYRNNPEEYRLKHKIFTKNQPNPDTSS